MRLQLRAAFMDVPMIDNAALVVAGTQGVWRLAGNTRDYSMGLGQFYGITFSAVEAL